MRHIRLVIASPNDVRSERDAVQQVAEELNKILGRANDFAIDVLRWETDSGPGFHLQGPQGNIDNDLKIEDCDILVAIFWTRFGTRILRGRETGTEHEINLAYKGWNKSKKKPQILIYFKSAPVDPLDIDIDQLTMLKAFRSEFNPKGKYKTGIYEVFSSLEDFKDKLRPQLARHLPTNALATSTPSSGFDFDGYRAKFGYSPKWDLSNIGVAQSPGDGLAPCFETNG